MTEEQRIVLESLLLQFGLSTAAALLIGLALAIFGAAKKERS